MSVKTVKTGNKSAPRKRLIIKLADEYAVITDEIEAKIIKLLDGTDFVIAKPDVK